MSEEPAKTTEETAPDTAEKQESDTETNASEPQDTVIIKNKSSDNKPSHNRKEKPPSAPKPRPKQRGAPKYVAPRLHVVSKLWQRDFLR